MGRDSPLQDLGAYRLPAEWNSGVPLLIQALWTGLAQPLVASALPGDGWRRNLLRAFGARLGRGGTCRPRFRVKFPWRLVVGDHCWLGEASWIDNPAPVVIGDRVCISQGAYLCTGNHDYRSVDFDLRLGPIQIDSDAWICAHCVVAPGTRVGAAAVVSLGSVASGVIAPGAIVAGNPAVVVGWR
ncbi:putative colanic acid biosynthesis acetyltransferase [Synechococcus sp. CS-1327]|uniref:putative colanic acid biosynthesis acetyltransferase n=1 Tax=Synechococcus sp. CS-1327 TaxID=2847977 RepID=UPI00223BD4E7|nr:putative colanic acid biosynthesis acetyltransferase [Synechococcus sp. CS-1327]MCT0232990.1 putative colanic acid biosynthesis acetyltransferase [Synechococcus sp. CS-1327]